MELHLYIMELNKDKEIESIELNINDNLIVYLRNEREPSPDGWGSYSCFVLRRMLIINSVKI